MPQRIDGKMDISLRSMAWLVDRFTKKFIFGGKILLLIPVAFFSLSKS